MLWLLAGAIVVVGFIAAAIVLGWTLYWVTNGLLDEKGEE